MTALPTLLPTTVVGSYPQPDWLIDRQRLNHNKVPRVRAPEMWRFSGELLELAQNDATILAIRDMERAGIDVITDGEIRRESYSNHFATALEGIDFEKPAEIIGRGNRSTFVPRVVARISRGRPVEVRDVEFLRANTDRTIKITLPGPFTMAQQAKNEFYADDADDADMAMDYAVAVNEEARALKAAGANVIQLDEPWMEERPEAARRYGVAALDRALEGIDGPTVVHCCFGYAFAVQNKPGTYHVLPQLAQSIAQQVSIEAAQPKLDLGVLQELSAKMVLLGVLDMGRPDAETADEVADRIRAGLRHIAANRLIPAPDCGMKFLPRAVAFAKLKALADGAAKVRRELAD
jgi:5-methyltetrahydropteroyltriglutamate--homocysteine methyltransferase